MSAFSVESGDRLVLRLVEACSEVGEEEREAMLARLVLLLAAEVADLDRVLAAVDAAVEAGVRNPRTGSRSGGRPAPPP